MLPLQAIIDNLPDAVFLVNKQGSVIHVNEAAVRIYGFADAQEGLRPLSEYPALLELMHIDGLPLAENERPLARALAGEQFRNLRLLARTMGGREMVIETSGGPVRDAGGETICGIVVDRDVTAQRRDELCADTFAAIAEALATERRLSGVLDVIAQETDRVIGADRAVAVWRLDAHRQELELLTIHKDARPETLRTIEHMPVDAPFITARAARSRQVQVVEDITSLDEEPREGRANAQREGVRSVVSIPLCIGDRAVGVLSAASRHPRPVVGTDVSFLTKLGNLFAVALENAWLNEQVEESRREAASGLARLEAVLASVPDPVFIADQSANIVDVNAAALELLGLAEKQQALRPAAEYEGLFQSCRDYKRQQCQESSRLTRALAGERLRMEELSLRRNDGTELLVQFSSAPVLDDKGVPCAAVVVARDITALRTHTHQAEVVSTIAQAIARGPELDQMIETVIDQTMVGLGADFVTVFLADPEREELVLRGQRGLRQETAEILAHVPFGSSFLAAQAYSRCVPQIVEDIGSSGLMLRMLQVAADVEGIRSLASFPLRATGRCVGALSYGSHSPRRFPAEEVAVMSTLVDMFGSAIENCRLYEWSQLRAAELEEERKRREQFIAVVAHELRGPMTILMGYSQVLERWGSMPADVQQRTVTVISEQTRKLNRLVADLLDASRITAGQFAVQRGVCDLVALARSVVEQQQVTSSGHTLRLDLPEGPQTIVGFWDEDRITQALNNLVSNAIKYSPEGGQVQVTLRRVGGEAKVSVQDYGVGIPHDHIPLLFQPYSRLYRDRRAKGVGLGLYITKGIVEAHGGHLWVESEPGKGSVFHFTLPSS